MRGKGGSFLELTIIIPHLERPDNSILLPLLFPFVEAGGDPQARSPE
jgi:hypothetical protein